MLLNVFINVQFKCFKRVADWEYCVVFCVCILLLAETNPLKTDQLKNNHANYKNVPRNPDD